MLRSARSLQYALLLTCPLILSTVLGCSGGSSPQQTASPPSAVAPSALKYSQPNLRGSGGVTLTDTATFTGSPATFTVSPTLPTGLSLDASTGAISGRVDYYYSNNPTFFTVTATNSAGSTTAKIQIYIERAQALHPDPIYPTVLPLRLGGTRTTLNLTVGEPAPTSLPYSDSIPPSFAAAQALFTTSAMPAGLSLDPATGAIYGAPAAVSAATDYGVAVKNSLLPGQGGLSIAVSKALDSIVDAEGSGAVTTLTTSSRVLTLDGNEHWTLFDAATGTKIAAGNRLPSTTYRTGDPDWPIEMKGNTIMIGIPNGVEIRSAVDGSLISIIGSHYIDTLDDFAPNPLDTRAALSSDGNYVVGSDSGTVELYSRSGSWITTLPQGPAVAGIIKVLALPTAAACLVARSTTTQTTLTSVNPVTGESTTLTLDGALQGFFDDGSRLFTQLGTALYLFDTAGNKQALSLGTYDSLGGFGSRIWTYNSTSGTLSIFPVSGGAATDTYTFTGFKRMSTVKPGLLSITTATANTFIDLSGSAVTRTDYTLPGDVTAVSAASATQWFGNYNGRLTDGVSLSNGTPTFLSKGQITAIAGSSTKVAVAFSNGVVQYFDTATKNLLGTINVQAGDLALSSDGTTLAVGMPDPTNTTAGQTRIYSLLTGTMTASSVYRPSTQLSPNGINLGYTTFVAGSGPTLPTLTGAVVPSTGGAPLWTTTSTTNSSKTTWHISPDLTLFGVKTCCTSSGNSIYKNGSLLSTPPDEFLGWIDNDNLLVSRTTSSSTPTTTYSIYTAAGTLRGTTPLPSSISNFVPVDSNRIYATSLNAIYALSSGNATWTWGLPTYNQRGRNIPSLTNGVISGPYVVFINGYRVMRDLY